jgi:hypothetical protein
MTDYDPFSSAPADEPTAVAQPYTPVTEAPVAAPAAQVPMTTGDPEAITTTFKGGNEFSAPWVVTRAPSVAAADALLTPEIVDYMDKVQKIGRKFVEQGQTVNAQPAQQQTYQPQQQPAQTQAPAASQGDGRMCAHGQMVMRSGFNAQKQQAWTGYFCPTPKGTPNQCKAQFIN